MLIVLLDRNKNDVLYNCDKYSGCASVVGVLINIPPNKTKNGQF